MALNLPKRCDFRSVSLEAGHYQKRAVAVCFGHLSTTVLCAHTRKKAALQWYGPNSQASAHEAILLITCGHLYVHAFVHSGQSDWHIRGCKRQVQRVNKHDVPILDCLTLYVGIDSTTWQAHIIVQLLVSHHEFVRYAAYVKRGCSFLFESERLSSQQFLDVVGICCCFSSLFRCALCLACGFFPVPGALCIAI